MPTEISSEIVTLNGSSSSVPNAPLAALRSAVPVNDRSRLPETSAKPPSPPSRPPRAVMRPAKAVWTSDHTTTAPPWPARVASAEITVAASAEVSRARGSGPSPRNPPPMLICPPPSGPEASRRAPARRMRSPVASIAPPLPRRALASSRPETATSPPPPLITIAPPRFVTLRASITPERLTACRAASRAAAARISTRSPRSAPELSISAPSPSPEAGNATASIPFGNFSVARRPEPSPTVPSSALITPEFSTSPPRSAA